jgi:hypothetical protein
MKRKEPKLGFGKGLFLCVSVFQAYIETTETNIVFRTVPILVTVPVSVVSKYQN